jgi:hypothetical protein
MALEEEQSDAAQEMRSAIDCLQEAHSAAVVALRDSELLLLPNVVLDAAAAASTAFSIAPAHHRNPARDTEGQFAGDRTRKAGRR